MKKANIVGILGGMGPAAGADFARLFVQACTERMHILQITVSDQAFPEHWLVQAPIPDRSLALESTNQDRDQPLTPMLQAMGKLAAVGATTVAIACNTAHAWHGALQKQFPQIEVLHIAREVAQTVASWELHEVGLLATEGTYRSALYGEALRQSGLQCHIPLAEERQCLMHGIYDGVKTGNLKLARQCFSKVAQAMVRRHGISTLIMGCTEIPLALTSVPGKHKVNLVDPAALLAQRLAQRAYAM
jgi:aspartate racemase